MKRIWGVSFICLLVSQVAFSGNPGHLFRTSVEGATLTVNSTIPNWTYPHAGISSSQSSISFSGCSHNANGQCIFSVSDTQSASLTISRATTPILVHICQDGYGNTYNCEKVTVELPGSAYVTNYNEATGFVSLCDVDSRTGALNNCISANYDGEERGALRRIVLNSAATLAYIANQDAVDNGGGIILCQIDPTTRLLTNCNITAAIAGASDIVFTPSGTRAYVTNYVTAPFPTGSISRCNVDTLTGDLTDCANIKSAPAVTGIVLNSAGTIAYYSQAGGLNTITYCSVSPLTGELNGCLPTGTGFNTPQSVTLNPSGTYAYISNSDNGNNGNISVCRVDAFNGALSGCENTSDLFSGQGGVEFNATGTLAYFPSFNTNRVYQCNVSSSTGLLSDCVNSGGAPFTNPAGLAFINY